MLTRICINNYKSLADVQLHLKPLSTFFGPNSSGKSNLLDALQLLSRIATARTLREAFEPPHRGLPLESFTFGPEGIQSLLGKDSAALSLEADIRLSPSVVESVNRQIRETSTGLPPESFSLIREEALRYRIVIEIVPRSGLLRVADESLEALDSRDGPGSKRSVFLERKGDRLSLCQEGTERSVSFDLNLNHSILSTSQYPLHHPHLAGLKEELSRWRFFYFEPHEHMRKPSLIQEVWQIGPRGEDLASFLNTLEKENEPQFHAIEKALRMIVPSISGLRIDVNDRAEVELKLIENGVAIPERLVSEGTLRILALLAVASAPEPPSLVGLEEPENSIHPRQLPLIVDLLRTMTAGGGTQLVTTTHSPLLLDLLPVDSLYGVRRHRGTTEIQPISALAGRPLSDPDPEPPSVSGRVLRGDFE